MAASPVSILSRQRLSSADSSQSPDFEGLVIKGIGFSSREALLLQMPEGLVANISTYGCSIAVWYLTKRFPKVQSRVAVIVAGELIGLIASIFLYTLPMDNIGGRLTCLWLAKFFLGPYIISLELNIANISGHTKKTTVQALIFMAYCGKTLPLRNLSLRAF
jgi:MFS transporter, ACS family, allantoate permease